MSFDVVTDSSANLPKFLTDRRNIRVLPFPYYLNGKTFNCSAIEKFDGQAFYERMKNGELVTTSQITPDHYLSIYEESIREGHDVLCITMSSGISGTWNSACVAAQTAEEEYPGCRVRVIDAKGASLGEGLLALRAAELRDKGADIEEAARAMEQAVGRMCNIFTVDDLFFLKRGGRLSNLAAIIGSMLQLKPLLKGDEDGKIVAFSKLLGRERSIRALADRYDRLVRQPFRQIVGIAQAGCPEDAEKLAKLLKRKNPPKEILTVEYEPVTGSHVGPGALALFFEGAEQARCGIV